MNFSVHMDEKTAAELAELARETGKTRNALLVQAVREFVSRRRPKKWPEAVLEHLRSVDEPLDLPPFESWRAELVPPGEPLQ